ncbi:MAG: transcriptional regulator NrdR [Candidatus Jacksonbacteria bacterium]
MLCPICNQNTKVLESRTTAGNTSIRRRRECLKCLFRFSTVEEAAILDLQVIKSNQSKVSYSRDKLIQGLKKSLHKRLYSEEIFKKLIADIERDIQIKAKNNIITAIQIGEIVMKYLKHFDKVAYVRFASVYRDFKDPEEFAKEVMKLKKSK